MAQPKWLKNIVSWIRGVFDGFEEFVRDYIQPSIDFIERLRPYIESNMVATVTDMTPTNVDDVVLNAVRTTYGYLFPDDKPGDDELTEQVIQRFVTYLRTLSPSARDALLKKLASLIASELARVNGDELTEEEADNLVQNKISEKRFVENNILLKQKKYKRL